MIDLQIDGDELDLLLDALPRLIAELQKRIEWYMLTDNSDAEQELVVRELACKRLLDRCQHAHGRLMERMVING